MAGKHITVNDSTSILPEGSNLYYTNARGIASTLTAYAAASGTVSATDTILEALQKIDANNIFTIPFVPGALSPADNTTYYFNIHCGTGVPTATATNWDGALPFNTEVIGAVISVGNNTVAGSAENCTFSIRNTTAGTSNLIGNFTTNGSTADTKTTTIGGVSVLIPANELFCAQIVTPAYATNPTTMVIRGYIICRRY